jgi:uncharacterized protein (PEP-CTERM system associated)
LRSGVKLRRVCASACVVAAATASASWPARAQSFDYFSTPWILEPQTTLPGQPQPPANDIVPPFNVDQPTAYSDIFGFATQVGNPSAPPYQLTPRLGLSETLTDNVGETHTDRQWDLISSLSAGFLAGADTAHMTGLLSYTGVLQDYLHDTHSNNFSNFGFGTAHITLLPGEFFIDLRASADDVLRSGGGLANPVIQNGNATQVYIVSASPYFTTRIGDAGFAILRYQFSQAWFNQNTAPITLPLSTTVGPISNSTNQQARADLKFPGTLAPRLASNISLSASSADTGFDATGNFERALGELINEYELTRSLSAIGGIGYEALKDNKFTAINGQGVTYDIGGRWQPNADSSVLLLYGRHDLKSDIGGEIEYRITPFTSFYAAYTDSIQTSQNTLIAANDADQLNPAGPVAGITYDQNPAISTLNDASLAMAADPSTLDVPLGLPLSDIDNFSPLQNDIYRTKSLQGIVYSNVASNPISLVLYDVQQTSLTGQIPPQITTRGANLNYSPTLSPDLFGLATVGYNLVSTDHAHVFNAGVGARYLLSQTLSVAMRYDFILRTAHPNTSGYVQNAVTLSINKNF